MIFRGWCFYILFPQAMGQVPCLREHKANIVDLRRIFDCVREDNGNAFDTE